MGFGAFCDLAEEREEKKVEFNINVICLIAIYNVRAMNENIVLWVADVFSLITGSTVAQPLC